MSYHGFASIDAVKIKLFHSNIFFRLWVPLLCCGRALWIFECCTADTYFWIASTWAHQVLYIPRILLLGPKPLSTFQRLFACLANPWLRAMMQCYYPPWCLPGPFFVTFDPMRRGDFFAPSLVPPLSPQCSKLWCTSKILDSHQDCHWCTKYVEHIHASSAAVYSIWKAIVSQQILFHVDNRYWIDTWVKTAD